MLTYRKEIKELPKPLENFARGLLATTCLTVACGASAVAGTITEGTLPAPNDFPNNPNGFLLPIGTTIVNGFTGSLPSEGGFDSSDWFEFQGLVGGAQYTITGLSFPGSETGENVQFFDDASNSLGVLDIGESGGNPVSLAFVAPANGNLVVTAFNCCEGSSQYTVSLTSNAPEPSTIAGVGLGLGAIALAWRRKRAS